MIRELAHKPFGLRPTILMVTVRRYRCAGYGHVRRQDTSRAAEPWARLSWRALRWTLKALVVQHLTVTRIAEALGVAWDTANDAVLAEGKRILISVPARFDGVTAIGVYEHVWRHTSKGDRYVTVIIALTVVRTGTGPAPDRPGCSTWLKAAPSRRSRPGCPNATRPGETGSRWWRWTGSPASRPPPPKSSPRRPRSWTRSTSCAWPATHSTSAGAASSGSFTLTAVAPVTGSHLPPQAAHRRGPAHRQAESPSMEAARRGRARRGRSDLSPAMLCATTKSAHCDGRQP